MHEFFSFHFPLCEYFFWYFVYSPNKFSNGLFFTCCGSNILSWVPISISLFYFILFYLFFWLNLLSSTTIPKDKGKHTVEALISGQPQDVKKESITGAGRL